MVIRTVDVPASALAFPVLVGRLGGGSGYAWLMLPVDENRTLWLRSDWALAVRSEHANTAHLARQAF